MDPTTPESQQLPAGLAEFYEAFGNTIIPAGGVLWFDGGAFSMMSIPTNLFTDIAESEVRQILSRSGKLAAVYRVARHGDATVPLFVLRDKEYGPGHLQRQFRQQVRAASVHMEVRECPWGKWASTGLRCDQSTLARRGLAVSAPHPLLSPVGRKRIAEAAQAVPGLGLLACFHSGEIAAYMVHLTLGEVCEGLLAHRGGERFASQLLYYSFARAAIARPEIKQVSVGRQSVPANESLARFKRHAGLVEEPCHLRIRLHPLLAPILENRHASALLGTLRRALSVKVPALANLEVIERAGCGAR
jgi:hypothetical protein